MSELSPVKRALIEIERMQRELERLKRRSAEPIAIVGIACRFPGGARDPESFWNLLADGRDAITEVPRTRWDIDAFYDKDASRPASISSRWGGFLDDIDRFDAAFFGISPREAAAMDPQQRLLLEVAWEAIEDAGLPIDRLSGSATAVFTGSCSGDYERLHYRRPEAVDIYTGTGTTANVLAGRLAYLFNFRGPAVALDTACSSSLVAVHMACQSLRAAESDVALAAGVNLLILPERHICASRMGMLAPDGRCKTFDGRADGFVRSEACAVVVLKRLADALAHGDPIHAVIRGTASNQDGRSAGLTAPNGRAQEAVIRRALENGGVDPADVEYIETHGAGTSLGDPIEVEALASVYGAPSNRPCVLGAVKTNIGHTEAAAGIAGLIKAVLTLKHAEIPTNLHFERINPNISIDQTRLALADSRRLWRRDDRSRYAAVSSFGWSGTNVHVVLEQAPAREVTSPESRDAYVLPVSARNRDALREMTERYAACLAPGTLGDIVYTAGVRRTHHEVRIAAVGGTVDELADALHHAETSERLIDGGIGFVYPGQGGQWPGMGRELYEREAAFREVIDECDALIHRHAGWSLVDALRSESPWDEIDRAQPALLAVSLALTHVWKHWGVHPSIVVGHSMGEIAAACVAGALSLRDAVDVICTRSRLMRRVRARGAMAVVELGREAAEDAIARFDERVAVAASNSARSTVISGDADAVDALMQQWEQQGIYCRRVQVDVASHSRHVDSLQPDLGRALSHVQPQKAAIRMISTVTGQPVIGTELDAEYWGRNLREPVRFAEAIRTLLEAGCRTFVEIGPHPVLSGEIRESLGRQPGLAVCSLRRNEPERTTMLRNLSAIYAAGADVAWARVNGDRGACRALPAYAWQRQRYWLEDPADREVAPRTGYVTVAGEHASHVWVVAVDPGHTVLGRDVMPAAGYFERALAAARQVLEGEDWQLRDVMLTGLLESQREAQLVIEEREEGPAFGVYSRAAGERRWQRHAAGRLERTARQGASPLDLDAIRARCTRRVSDTEFYERLARRGLEYSGPFRQVVDAWAGSGESLTRLAAPNLDACLQDLSLAIDSTSDEVHVPVSAARVWIDREFGGPLWAWARWCSRSGHVVVAREDGRIVAEIEGLELASLMRRANEWLWNVRWHLTEAAPGHALTGRWLIVGAGFELARRLRQRGAETQVIAAADFVRSIDAELSGVIWLSSGDDINGVVTTIKALEHQGRRDAPRLVLVTRGTQPVGGGPREVDGAELWGLGQVIHHEHPRLQCCCVDLSVHEDAAEWSALADEIAAASSESRVALRGSVRYVARLSRCAAPLGRSLELSSDAAYLITGGLGGVGLSVAARLIDRGARHLVLLGRRAPTDAARAQIAAWDADVRTRQVDVASRAELAALFAEIRRALPPLRGVLHAAGVLDDATLLQVTPERVAGVTRPKIAGAWNLHELSAATPLDFFVLFSSATTILGGPGQAAYAAANAYLDALAHYRQSLGLPALSIDWGRWASIGMVAESSRADQLSAQGILPMSPADALDLLELLIASSERQAAALAINFRQWSERYPQVASLPLFDSIRGELARVQPTAFARDLASMDAHARVRAIGDVVRAQAEATMRLRPGTLSAGSSFFASGLDSMTALELRNRLENALDLTIPATAIWASPTVTGLATYLAERVRPDATLAADDEALLARVLEEAARPTDSWV